MAERYMSKKMSTSTILRLCDKNNFEGYAAYKEALKKEIALKDACMPMEDLYDVLFYDFSNTL